MLKIRLQSHTPKLMDNCLLSISDRAGNINCIEICICCSHNFVDGICTICGRNEYEDYILSSDNYSLCGITKEGDISIPDTFEYKGQKYRTVGIDRYAFNGDSITSVNIPNGVKTIGDNAFNKCLNLTTINVPNSVTNFTDYSFAGCINVINMYYDSNCKINMYLPMFKNEQLTITIGKNVNDLSVLSSVVNVCGSVVLEDGGKITNLSDEMFMYGQFKSIVLPSTLNKIPNSAFEECANLNSVYIPDSIVEIGYHAFYNCSSLTSVTIPDSITSIRSNTFYNVPHITYHGTATGSPWGALAMN